MFRKKQPTRSSARARQPSRTVNESFRRNNVVISSRQKEIAQRQKSVTQRQIEFKKAASRHLVKVRFVFVSVVLLLLGIFYRMNLGSVSVETNASSKLTSAQKLQYESLIYSKIGNFTLSKQSWLLDTAALSKELTTTVPEIERVTFSSSAPLSTVLRADIRFRKPVFTWRDASNTDQFVDSNGVLFAKNLDPTVNTSKLIKIEDQSGTVLAEGTSVLTENVITFIGQLHSQVRPLYGEKATHKHVW